MSAVPMCYAFLNGIKEDCFDSSVPLVLGINLWGTWNENVDRNFQQNLIVPEGYSYVPYSPSSVVSRSGYFSLRNGNVSVCGLSASADVKVEVFYEKGDKKVILMTKFVCVNASGCLSIDLPNIDRYYVEEGGNVKVECIRANNSTGVVFALNCQITFDD